MEHIIQRMAHFVGMARAIVNHTIKKVTLTIIACINVDHSIKKL